jgi:hypothetical protein
MSSVPPDHPEDAVIAPEDVVVAPEVVARLREQLPGVAEQALAAVTAEVPEYARTMSDAMARAIEPAIVGALGGFLRLLEADAGAGDDRAPMPAAREGAYELGRGEARSGRSVDALLAAYRIGARVSWREMSATAVAQGVPAPVLARFAELVFAYIDELSGASLSGHADELAASGRVREQRLGRLGQALAAGAAPAKLDDLAEHAEWTPPETLTAVLLPVARAHDTVPHLDVRTLTVPGDAVDLPVPDATDILLLPDAGRTRAALLRRLEGRGAVVGPARPWRRAVESLELALRAHRLLAPVGGELVDAEQHRDALVVGADPGALDDLRSAVLAPLADLKPAAAERLADTLQAWLLHLGRRGEVAEALHVHPQTVRYRMDQVRELYGDRLEDPATVQQLVIALAVRPTSAAPGDGSSP